MKVCCSFGGNHLTTPVEATHVMESFSAPGTYIMAMCDRCALGYRPEFLEFFDESKHNLDNIVGAEEFFPVKE
jgi:hypothetical protein